MEFLSSLAKQVGGLYGRLSASQRVTFLLLVAMMAGSLVLLVVLGGRADWAPLASTPMPADQLAGAAAALQRAGIDHRDRGGLLEVRQGERYRALAALTEGNALPRSFDFHDLLTQNRGLGSLHSREELSLQEQIALQTELGRIISRFQGVTAAQVFLSGPPRRRLDFGAPKNRKASVTLRLEPGQTLAPGLVQSVANLVQGAVLGLNPEDVTVIDAVHNVVRRLPPDEEAYGSSLLEQKRAAEKDLRGKLLGVLGFIPGLLVDVCVELKPTRETKTTDTVKPDASVIPRKLEEREETTTTGAPAASGPPAGTSGGATLAVPAGPSTKVVESVDETTGERYTTEKAVVFIPPGTIERITATIIVPLSYYRGMAAASLPQGQEPDEQKVATLAGEDKAKIQQNALGVLGPKAKVEDIIVDTRFVPIEPAVAVASLAGSGGAGRLAERYGPTAALAGLSGAFLLLLSRWVRRPAVAAAAPSPALAAAGGPEEAALLLPLEPEVSTDTKRFNEMRKRIQEFVKEDPANAANLVNHWLNQG